MLKGTIFFFFLFSINDGPGVRITVFMKGCPLRCQWCHNPEGISSLSQYNEQTKKFVGNRWEVDDLVEYLMSYGDFFEQFNGGVTFSGGEPALQADFLLACVKQMPNIHKLLDTSGYCAESVFSLLIQHFDAFYFDLKLAHEKEHIKYTGHSNQCIIRNLNQLAKSGKKFTIRMPMIPWITDTGQNLEAISKLIVEVCKPDVEIHLLPYNKLAGGKYPIYGMTYPLKAGYQCNQLDNILKFEKKMTDQGYMVKNYVEENTNG